MTDTVQWWTEPVTRIDHVLWGDKHYQRNPATLMYMGLKAMIGLRESMEFYRAHPEEQAKLLDSPMHMALFGFELVKE